MKKRLLMMFLLGGTTLQAKPLHLTLDEAQKRAIDRTPRLHSVKQEKTALEEQTRSARSTYFPKLSLDGSYRYVSQIPQLQIGPTPTVFGDNSSYSIGPTLSYTIFDAGARSDGVASLRLMAEAKGLEQQALERSVRASVRGAYVKAQLARQERQLVLESFQVTQAQSRDVDRRYKAGSASKLDALNAKREVASYEVKLSQSHSDQRSSEIDLLSWIGEDESKEIDLDPLRESVSALDIRTLATLDPATHPRAVAQGKLAESAARAAEAQSAGFWPSVSLQLRTSLDYPNGPVRERIHQNTVQVGLAMPLWDWGKTAALASQKRAEEQAARAREQEVVLELRREYQKAIERMESLRQQKQSALEAVEHSETLAKLSYQSYRAGQISLVDVQAANLRRLEAKVLAARLDASRLLQAIQIRALLEQGESR